MKENAQMSPPPEKIPHKRPTSKTSRRVSSSRISGIFASALLLMADDAVAGSRMRTDSSHLLHTNPQAASQQEAPPPMQIPDMPRMQFDGGTFGFEVSEDGPELVFERDGSRRSVPVPLPPADVVGDPVFGQYGENYTFMLTRNPDTRQYYVITTLGAAAVAAGRETLPGNDFLVLDCVLLTEEPVSHSVAGDKFFLFYGGNRVGIVEGATGRLRTLTIEGVSENSVVVCFAGLDFMLQPNATPVVILGRNEEGAYVVRVHDHNSSQLESFLRFELESDRLYAFFLDKAGREIRFRITVGEEGDPETVDVRNR